MRSGRCTLAAVGDGPLTSDQGVGGRLEVVAVGLPAGGGLAFGELATLRGDGISPVSLVRVLGPERGPIVRRPHVHHGRVTLGVGRRLAHSPDRRRGVREAVVPLRVDRLLPGRAIATSAPALARVALGLSSAVLGDVGALAPTTNSGFAWGLLRRPLY
jgi:hypothetical protein